MDWIAILLIGLPLAIAPGIAIALFIYFRDKYEKEPFKLIRNCFLFGLLSIVPPFLIESAAPYAGIDAGRSVFITFIYAFFIVSLSEELSKFFFLRIYAYRKSDFNEPMDGIVYSVMISMGFATLENILYAFQGLPTTMLRMFTAVPLHATCAIIMGYFIGLAKFSKGSFWKMLVGIGLAVTIHGFYDFFLFVEDYPALAILAFVTLALAIGISFIAIHHHRKVSPFKNISLNPQETETGGSPGGDGPTLNQ